MIASGFMTGYVAPGDGLFDFEPNFNLTRAEAVMTMCNVLDRKLTAAGVNMSLAKTFPDVKPGFWAYYSILEASSEHGYYRDENNIEHWIKLL
jgi:hypothetical protein